MLISHTHTQSNKRTREHADKNTNKPTNKQANKQTKHTTKQRNNHRSGSRGLVLRPAGPRPDPKRPRPNLSSFLATDRYSAPVWTTIAHDMFFVFSHPTDAQPKNLRPTPGRDECLLLLEHGATSHRSERCNTRSADCRQMHIRLPLHCWHTSKGLQTGG